MASHPPYTIEKRKNQFCVINGLGELKHCFDSHAKAKDYQEALYAAVPAKKKHLAVLSEQGPVKLNVEIADTAIARIKGLSGRGDLPSDGMLFDFGAETLIPMTARSCLVDIFAQFFAAAGEKLGEVWMPAGDPGPFWSPMGTRYVLESASERRYSRIIP